MIKILKTKKPYYAGFWINGYEYWKINNHLFLGIKDCKLQRLFIRLRNKVLGII